MGENLFRPVDSKEAYYETEDDDAMGIRRKSILSLKSESLGKRKKSARETIETEEEIQLKKRLIRLHVVTACLHYISYSMTVSSLWPFLTTFNERLGEIYLGLIMTSRFGSEIITSMIFRYWTLKRNAKEPMLISSILYIAGNLLYGLAQGTGVMLVLVSRVILGVSAGIIGVSKLEVIRLSKEHDKKRHTTYLGMALSCGYFLGPLLQNAFTLIGAHTLHISKRSFKFDMYSGPAYTLAILGALHFIIILFYYKMGNIKLLPISSERNWWSILRGSSIDKMSFAVLVLIYIVLLLNVVQRETLFGPIIMTLIGLTRIKTIQYGASLATISALLGFIGYVMVPLLKMNLSNRKILLLCLAICIINYIVYQPAGPGRPISKLKESDSKNNTNRTISTDKFSSCPAKYDWCYTTPKMKLAQYSAFIIIDAIISPISFTILPIIFHRIISDDFESYMSLLSNIECLGKLAWPLYATALYHGHGLLGVAQVSLWLTIMITVLYLLIWKRLDSGDN